MKLQALLVIVFAFIVSACGESQTSAPTDAAETTGVIKLPLPVPESEKKAAVRQAGAMVEQSRRTERLSTPGMDPRIREQVSFFGSPTPVDLRRGEWRFSA